MLEEEGRDRSFKLYEQIPIPIIILNDAGQIVDANSKYLTLLGYSRSEVLWNQPTKFIETSDKNKFSKWFISGLKNNHFEEVDLSFINKTCGILFLRVNAQTGIEPSSGSLQVSCAFLNVTEQQKVLYALKLSEFKFRSLLESTPDAMVIVNRHGEITYVNDQTNRYFGYKPGELLGEKIEVLIPEGFHHDHLELRQGFINKPHPRQMGAGMELYAMRKDGSEFPVEISLNYQKAEPDLFILAAIRDITERKKVEEKLRESRERFSSAFEYAAIGMALVSLEGKWLKVNQSVCKLVGYSREELMKMTFQDITYPEDLDLDLENLNKMLRGEIRTYRIEKRYYHKNGQIVWVLLSVSLVRSSESQPLYFISQIEDITEWKITQEALTKSEERFRLTASGTGLGIWEWNKTKGNDYVSDKFCELLGYQKEELEPDLAQIMKSIHPRQIEAVRKELRNHLLENEVFRIEFQLKKKNGKYGWFLAAGQAEFDENRTPVRMVGYLVDISKQKQAEDRFKSLFSSSPDGIIMLDTDKKILMANHHAEKIFGYSGYELVDKPIDHFIPQFVFNLEKRSKKNSKKQDKTYFSDITLDLDAFRKDGKRVPVEIALNRMDEKEDSLIIITIRDVTERLLADVERKRILAALNVVTDGIFMFESDSLRHIYVNAGASKQIGYSEEELLEMTPLDFKIEYTEERFREMLQPLVAGEKKSITIETVHLHKNGTKIQVEIIFQTAVLDTSGKVVVAVVRNITERKLAEEALHLSEERFRELYENSTFGIYRTSISGKIILANPALIKLLGFDSFEELQKRNLETEGYSINDSRLEFIKRIESEGRVTDIESIWTKKDGTQIYVRESAKLIIDKHTGEHFYDGTVEDISEKRHAEKERIARQAAEEANKAKSIFLANMSHEIRTPLNSIIGFSDMLYSTLNEPKAKSQVDSIRNSGRGLLRIINDILDLSKIEAGRLDLQLEPVNLLKLISESEIMFRQKAKENGILFFIEIKKSIPPLLKLDETRLRQILLNLIGNAIKFTHKGNVILSVDIYNQVQGKIDLLISVEDTGIGIPADQLEIIFEPFTQQEGQLEKKYGGTGLGLSITQRLVDIMGGQISVSSEVGKGSIFKVLLPDIEISENSVDVIEDNDFDPSQLIFEKALILIADDNKENRKLLKDYLGYSPVDILEAENGKKAVELAISEKPDLILMDLRMPEMNGIAATQIIKANPSTNHIPVIAISASSKIVFEEKIYMEVFDDFLIKPIVLSQLAELLKKHLKYTRREICENENTLKNCEIQLSEKQLAKLPELIWILETKFYPVYQEVLKKQEIDQIEKFGKDLYLLGSRGSFDLLIDFGQELCLYSDNFEIEKLMQKLKTFPDLVLVLQKRIK